MQKKTLLRFLPLVLIALTLVCALSVGALVSDLLAPSDAEGYSSMTEDEQDTSSKPLGADALVYVTQDNYCFAQTEQGAVIVDYLGETSMEGVLHIPDELGGMPVVGIGESAFENNASEGYNGLLGTVVLPDTLLFIGDRAFYDSHYVLGITFPASLVSIGDGAFYSCCNLENVTLPDGLQTIGDRAFSWCDCFTEIAIPASVTEIGESVFAGNKQLAIIDCQTSAQPEGWAANWLAECNAETVWNAPAE